MGDAELTNHAVAVTREFAANPDRVYRAWTEPDLMRRWLATVVEADVRVGGTFRMEMSEAAGGGNAFEGEYLELVPGKRIVQTFRYIGSPTGADPVNPGLIITDERLIVTLAQGRPGTTTLTLLNSWTGTAWEQSAYAELHASWSNWLARLEGVISA